MLSRNSQHASNSKLVLMNINLRINEQNFSWVEKNQTSFIITTHLIMNIKQGKREMHDLDEGREQSWKEIGDHFRKVIDNCFEKYLLGFHYDIDVISTMT
jgi:hypothetical protein